ncbi:MAG: pyruvate, phosphate dikinase/phosphoenolpyruvate synthase regulator [Candidatus Omnitrophica bacterium]|nr:pyruvate, phosphate dikinase/phosphoenolpyruvate synthase regulator [Candidatus Omnitrophota bacterium]
MEHFFNALLTQFPREKFHFQTFPFLKSESRLEKALGTIKGGVLFHAFVSKSLKDLIARIAKAKKIPCWDVTGPTAEFLETATGIRASLKPQPLHDVDIGYMGRMRAIEFAIQHDDSRRLDKLNEAEIILVGISRVSKSPTALFLAYRGFKVANVSMIPSQGLPPELAHHRRKNVVAFTMQPKQLAEIRQRRFQDWRLGTTDYESIESVIHEVMEAEAIYKKRKWPMIDTSGQAVEETSTLVLEALKLTPKIFTA